MSALERSSQRKGQKATVEDAEDETGDDRRPNVVPSSKAKGAKRSLSSGADQDITAQDAKKAKTAHTANGSEPSTGEQGTKTEAEMALLRRLFRANTGTDPAGNQEVAEPAREEPPPTPTPIPSTIPKNLSMPIHVGAPRTFTIRAKGHKTNTASSSNERKQKSDFNMIAKLAAHLDILLNIAQHLPPRALSNLYTVSSAFYFIMNSHYMSFLMRSLDTFAPGAEYIYPWRYYPGLCIKDPARRKFRPAEGKTTFVNVRTGENVESWAGLKGADAEGSSDVQNIPSLKWLKMVVYRYLVAEEIVAWLAVSGHRIDHDPAFEAVKKLWFILDLPINSLRIDLIRNRTYFTDRNLYVLTTFVLKLDMLNTDPINYTGGEFKMRHYLLQERSLTPVWNYLRRADYTFQLDVLLLHIRHGASLPERVHPEPEAVQRRNDRLAELPVFGVPPKMVGRMGYELYGLGEAKLLRPDELVMMEGIRRGLELQREWLRMIRSGFLDRNFETVMPPDKDDVVFSCIVEIKWRREEEERKQRREAEKKEATALFFRAMNRKGQP